MKQSDPVLSEQISDFLNLLRTAQENYQWRQNMIEQMNGLQQDYLHDLELNNLRYADRAKLATKLLQCRKERREHKDAVAKLSPLIQFLENDKGKQCQNQLRQVLGNTRKAEDSLRNRMYIPRVLDNLDDGHTTKIDA